ICMDQCMVDVGKNSSVKRWDKAILFGCREDGALQTADDIARLTDTISYEITTVLTRRVPRLYVD
ncbi:MAG TPA: alanine racemase, partial [Treponema sp.]|nr:alanine racemase [Treponema sp.]